MIKEFLPYDKVRNNALKLAHKIYTEGFIPDVIYVSLRGGAYMANVISEYFKLRRKNVRPVLFAAVVARSYTDVQEYSKVMVDGWTYSPKYLRNGDKILLVDDIFDTGNTINSLVNILLERGVPRSDIKVAVHDYKYFPNKEEQHPNQTVGKYDSVHRTEEDEHEEDVVEIEDEKTPLAANKKSRKWWNII